MTHNHVHWRTIWVVDAKTSRRRGLPAGPHLLLRDEPDVGETIVAKLSARPLAWRCDDEPIAYAVTPVSLGAAASPIRIWARTAVVRGFGDDSDAPEPRDISAEILAEILFGLGEWEGASVEVRAARDAEAAAIEVPAPRMHVAIGTDGEQPVVWGLGVSPDDAISAARRVNDPDELLPLITAEITHDQHARLLAGEKSTEALGIVLNAQDIDRIK